MKRTYNGEKFLTWAKSIGEVTDVTAELLKVLRCSPSKAEKIARGTYPSVPTPLEREALVKLTGISLDELFPVVETKKSESHY